MRPRHARWRQEWEQRMRSPRHLFELCQWQVHHVRVGEGCGPLDGLEAKQTLREHPDGVAVLMTLGELHCHWQLRQCDILTLGQHLDPNRHIAQRQHT